MMPFSQAIDNHRIIDLTPVRTVLFRYTDCPPPPSRTGCTADSTGNAHPTANPFNLPLAMPGPTPPYLWTLTFLA